MSSRLVWFQLLDSATGLPYKGTSADAVNLHHGSVAVQFRDAVKAKYADSHLSGIAPSDLRVYKNMAAFNHSRNLDEEYGKPLKSSHVLDNLGESEEEALIVTFTQALEGKTCSPYLTFPSSY
jgi:hypothetical protein